MPATRVFVVDDHPFFRSGVVHWLQNHPGLAFCGEAESIASARRLISQAKPDVLLLDIQLKDGDGLTFTTELCQELPALRIVILSNSEEDVFAHRALRAGARGYLMKSEATEAVEDAIESVIRGELFLSRRVAARLLHNLFPDPASAAPNLARLSDRELQVFQMLGAGCKNPDIAAALNISPKTVDTYRENLKQKLSLQNADALLKAATAWVERGDLADALPAPGKRKPETK